MWKCCRPARRLNLLLPAPVKSAPPDRTGSGGWTAIQIEVGVRSVYGPAAVCCSCDGKPGHSRDDIRYSVRSRKRDRISRGGSYPDHVAGLPDVIQRALRDDADRQRWVVATIEATHKSADVAGLQQVVRRPSGDGVLQ